MPILDRDGDGKVSKDEADRGALATLVRVANGGATAMPRGDLDVHPKDGVVSIDELSDALRTALGPFRVQAGKLASGKTDALFEHLDRDKDGKLARPRTDRGRLVAPQARPRRRRADRRRRAGAVHQPDGHADGRHARAVEGVPSKGRPSSS